MVLVAWPLEWTPLDWMPSLPLAHVPQHAISQRSQPTAAPEVPPVKPFLETTAARRVQTTYHPRSRFQAPYPRRRRLFFHHCHRLSSLWSQSWARIRRGTEALRGGERAAADNRGPRADGPEPSPACPHVSLRVCEDACSRVCAAFTGVSAAGAMSEPAGDVRQNPCGSKACRRLFGPVDSEQLSRDCDALMAGCIQEARERRNFDFFTETPLEGDFAWERVRGLGLPKLYLPTGPRRGRDELGGGRRPGTSPALLQGTAEEDHVDLSLSCTLVPRSGEQAEGSPGGPGDSQGRKRRQTSMTDFYHSKRRLIFSKRKP
uniref:Cyclin-dependent kinase inhibitor 1 n=1 Tax=Pan troglodytes TaxID=9598 RepID=K7DNI7_PANTR